MKLFIVLTAALLALTGRTASEPSCNLVQQTVPDELLELLPPYVAEIMTRDEEAMAQRVPEIGNLVESAICHGDASGQYGLFGEAYSACIAADSVAARSEEHSIDGLRAHMDFEVCLYTALGFFNPFLYQIHYNNVVDYMERLPIYLDGQSISDSCKDEAETPSQLPPSTAIDTTMPEDQGPAVFREMEYEELDLEKVLNPMFYFSCVKRTVENECYEQAKKKLEECAYVPDPEPSDPYF